MTLIQRGLAAHAGIWALATAASLFVNLTWLPIALLMWASIVAYMVLGAIIGATDPLYTTPDGTRIPQMAWLISQWTMTGLGLGWIGWAALSWFRGRKWPGVVTLHLALAVAGLLAVLLAGSINFPFRL